MREHALSCIHEIALVSELAPSTSGARASAFPRAAAPAAAPGASAAPAAFPTIDVNAVAAMSREEKLAFMKKLKEEL